jgi:hypothetical protein
MEFQLKRLQSNNLIISLNKFNTEIEAASKL